MAQAPKPMADADVVGQFETLTLQLIGEATAYVSGGVHNTTTEANIRKLRMLTQALGGALMQTNISLPIVPPT
jgi:hypothetical protein